MAKHSIIKRSARSLFSIIVLSAFVLGIAFFVKGLAKFDFSKLASLPVFNKLGNVGKVAGDFVKNVDSESSTSVQSSNTAEALPSTEKDKKELFRVAIIADSHEDNDLLARALAKAKNLNVSAVFYLGDYTNLGVIDALKTAKSVMDASGLTYYSLPGDHDLWKAVGPQNFTDVFGKNYQSVIIEGVKFTMLDNSANYTTINDIELDWFKTEVKDSQFVLLAQPLYTSTNFRVMGIMDDAKNSDVYSQNKEITGLIRNANVKAIISADLHNSGSVSDPVKNDLRHVVVGAVTKERNLQTPRFSLLTLFEDGDFINQDEVL